MRIGLLRSAGRRCEGGEGGGFIAVGSAEWVVVGYCVAEDRVSREEEMESSGQVDPSPGPPPLPSPPLPSMTRCGDVGRVGDMADEVACREGQIGRFDAALASNHR